MRHLHLMQLCLIMLLDFKLFIELGNTNEYYTTHYMYTAYVTKYLHSCLQQEIFKYGHK